MRCNRLQLAGRASYAGSSFQLTHMSHEDHVREDKNLLQRSQLRQHGEFRHVSVSERQRLRLCGQDLCGAFVRLYWQPTLKRAIEQWRPTAQQKRLYLHHQGEFQHQNCTVRTVHDSDHEGEVRIFVRHSYHSNESFKKTRGAQQSTYSVRNFDLTAIGLPPIIHTACIYSDVSMQNEIP